MSEQEIAGPEAAGHTAAAGSGDAGDVVVDPDLVALIDGVVGSHAGPHLTPDHTAVWDTLREVGLARLTASEATGGSGAGWAEAAALLRACAAAGVAVPYAETDLLAGPLRRAAGLDDSSDGTATVAVLGADGVARSVPWAGATDTVVCVRAAAGGGFELAEVDTAALRLRAVDGVSAEPRADVAVVGRAHGAVVGAVVGAADGAAGEGIRWLPVATAAVEAYVLHGALARSLQCVGAMEGMLEESVTHTTQRNQFGRPLARFQSVQNLVVDVAAETVLARAVVDAALADADATDLTGELSAYRIAVARSVVAQAVSVAVRGAHQVHGAIGTTGEHTLHRRTLPALQWVGEFGSAAMWEAALSRTAIAGGMDGAWPLVADGRGVGGVAATWLDAVTAA